MEPSREKPGRPGLRAPKRKKEGSAGSAGPSSYDPSAYFHGGKAHYFRGLMRRALSSATNGTVSRMPMEPATPRIISTAMASALKIWIRG